MQPHRCTQGVQEKKCNISTKQFNNMYGMRYYELSTCTSAVQDAVLLDLDLVQLYTTCYSCTAVAVQPYKLVFRIHNVTN
jgi:hypothetical protein